MSLRSLLENFGRNYYIHKKEIELACSAIEAVDYLFSVVGIGKHNHIPAAEFDSRELDMGIDVEKEHTDNVVEAEAIAKDHLVELPDYYTRLRQMENL